jgi:hypothetical protein
MSKDYCWMFGEHKSIPCPCGYPTKKDTEINNLKEAVYLSSKRWNRDQKYIKELEGKITEMTTEQNITNQRIISMMNQLDISQKENVVLIQKYNNSRDELDKIIINQENNDG